MSHHTRRLQRAERVPPSGRWRVCLDLRPPPRRAAPAAAPTRPEAARAVGRAGRAARVPAFGSSSPRPEEQGLSPLWLVPAVLYALAEFAPVGEHRPTRRHLPEGIPLSGVPPARETKGGRGARTARGCWPCHRRRLPPVAVRRFRNRRFSRCRWCVLFDRQKRHHLADRSRLLTVARRRTPSARLNARGGILRRG